MKLSSQKWIKHNDSDTWTKGICVSSAWLILGIITKSNDKWHVETKVGPYLLLSEAKTFESAKRLANKDLRYLIKHNIKILSEL
jgi:hypothetical protein